MEVNGKLRRQKIKCWVSSDDFILLMNKYLKECEVDFPEVYRGFCMMKTLLLEILDGMILCAIVWQ